MSRILKFRAWSKKRNRYLKRVAGIPNIIFLESEDIVLEQYIGIKDKNGKEIYEGDLVKQVWGEYCKQVWGEYCNLWKIVWNNKGFARFMLYGISGPIKGECDIAPSDEFEVIGNIHENPELLRGGEE